MSQPEKPTELIYLPTSSAHPALVAIGLAFVIVGVFAWWPYSVAGGLIALVALVGWLRRTRSELASMPKEQATGTAPLPLR